MAMQAGFKLQEILFDILEADHEGNQSVVSREKDQAIVILFSKAVTELLLANVL